jgi:hypothetical protein
MFDVTYGCAALKKWAPSDFITFMTNHTKPIYYDDHGGNGDDENDDGGDEGPDDGQPPDNFQSKRLQQAHDRNARAAKGCQAE